MEEMRETWVWCLGQGDPLEEGMATHAGVLAGRIPWTEEPGGLQSLGWEDPLEEGTAAHSSVLAWRTPQTEEPGGLQLRRVGSD